MNNIKIEIIKSVRIQERTFSIQTIEQFGDLYDYIYNIGDSIIKKYDPCESGAICNYKFCCIGCKYLKVGFGCTTKCLTCKFWTCHEVRKKLNTNVLYELGELMDLCGNLGFSGMRTSKEDILKYNILDSNYGKDRWNCLKSKYNGIKFVNWHN